MAAKEFDYETAWIELAKPSYDSLPQNVRDLVHLTGEVCGDLSQLPDCSMPWPTDQDMGEHGDAGAFRILFREIPAELLARAAWVVYFYGHWYPHGGEAFDKGAIDGKGATWRFSRLADQELRERLGLTRRDYSGELGTGFAVVEGRLVCWYSMPWCSGSVEVGLATPQNLDRARAVGVPSFGGGHGQRSANDEKWDRYAARLKKACGPLEKDTEPFMVAEGTINARHEAARKVRADGEVDAPKVVWAIKAIRGTGLPERDTDRLVTDLIRSTGVSDAMAARIRVCADTGVWT